MRGFHQHFVKGLLGKVSGKKMKVPPCLSPVMKKTELGLLRARVIHFNETCQGEFAMQATRKGIQSGPKDDHLFNPVSNAGSHKILNGQLAQEIVQLDAGEDQGLDSAYQPAYKWISQSSCQLCSIDFIVCSHVPCACNHAFGHQFPEFLFHGQEQQALCNEPCCGTGLIKLHPINEGDPDGVGTSHSGSVHLDPIASFLPGNP